YEEAMHVAAGGMLGAAILSGISGSILTVVLQRDCQSTYPLWGVSCLLLGAVLSMAPLLKHVGVGAVATQMWLAAVGPMYAVTCSVPYALVASISHVASSEAESVHPSEEDEGGGAMMGPIADLAHLVPPSPLPSRESMIHVVHDMCERPALILR
ncbi:hypothetical protein FOZ62_018356, partial [Perkinsus olseni]